MEWPSACRIHGTPTLQLQRSLYRTQLVYNIVSGNAFLYSMQRAYFVFLQC